MSVSKHLRQVKLQLYHNVFAAYRGWWQWHKVITKGVGKNTAVILLPDCNHAVNYMALLYLNDMLHNRGYNNALILTHDPGAQKSAALFSDKILRVVPFNRKKAEDLMQYYCLYEFDKRFIVASVDEPNGRSGSMLLGKRGTTQEEIFVIGVYHVYPFYRPEPPVYQGNDPVIKNFLEEAMP